MVRAKPKPKKKVCKQTVCPFFAHCKYGHDQAKCRTSLTFAGSDDEVAEIS